VPLQAAQAAGASGHRGPAGGGRRGQPRVGHRRPGRSGHHAGGARHLYQFQEHWITYRSTAEALKQECYLYLARAGPSMGRTGTASWPSGSKAWSPRSTLSGRPATSRPRVARKVDGVRTAVALVTT
jgi:hypothetical protein